MKENFNNYRDVLKFELESRHRKNPSYSLRAFARDMELSSSRLSEILSGKQGLSPERAAVVGKKIGYKEKKLMWFCDLVASETARSADIRAIAKTRTGYAKNGVTSKDISPKVPLRIKWYHYAIRRLTLMSEFKSDAAWISKRLNIPKLTVVRAIDELVETGLLTKSQTGRLTMDSNNVEIPAHAMNLESAAEMYQEMFEKAMQARFLPAERRRYGLHIFTLDKAQISELRDLIQEFEDKVDNLTFKAIKHDHLEALIISAFPLIADESATNAAESKSVGP